MKSALCAIVVSASTVCVMAQEAWRVATESAGNHFKEKRYVECVGQLEGVVGVIDQPKDKAAALSMIADAYYAMHQTETNKVLRTQWFEKNMDVLERIVNLDDCEDEQLKVDSALRGAERMRNLGQSDRAIELMNRALQPPPVLSPDNKIRLLLFRGSLEEARGWAKLAEKTYGEVAGMTARDINLVAQARNKVAAIYVDVMGKYAEAVKALDYPEVEPITEQKVSPRELSTRAYYLGRALQELKRMEEAKEQLRKSIVLSAGNGRSAGQAKLALGRLLLECGEKEPGLKVLDEAIGTKGVFGPDAAAAGLLRAHAFEAGGDVVQAKSEYERVLKLGGISSQSQEARHKLGMEAR